MGMFLFNKIRFTNVLITSLLSALLFFVLTNFACFLHGWYGYTWAGLVQTYTVAIPFFRMELLSTVLYSMVFWGIYVLVAKKIWAVR
jgi:hypothetical protein